MAGGIEFFCHPEYERRRADWQRYHDLWQGDHDTLVSNKLYLPNHRLEDHPLEGKALREIREALTRYLNLVEPVVSVYVSTIFFEPPTLDDRVRDLFGDEIEDVDGRGTDFFTFLQDQVATPLFRDGKVAVFTDAKTFDGETLADQAGHRAYFEAVPALALKDWQLTEGGRYRMLRWEYTEMAERPSLLVKPEELLVTKVLSLEGGVYVIREYQRRRREGGKAAWEQRGPDRPVRGFGELPVAAVASGESWIKDVCELQLELFQRRSEYASQLNYQAYDRVVFSGPMSKENKAAWSEYSAIVVPAGTTVTAIPAASTEGWRLAIAESRDMLFKVAFNRTHARASDSKEAPGAETLREEKDETIKLLLSAVKQLEGVANQMVRHYARFKGVADFKGKVTFNKEITTEDVDKQLEIYSIFRRDIDAIPEWRRATLEWALGQQSLPEGRREKILKEIERLEAAPARGPLAGFGPFLNNDDGGDDGGRQQGTQEADAGGAAQDQGGRGGGGQPGRGAGAVPQA